VPNKPLDLTRNPYRGVLAEVARREGVSRQAIQQALRSGNVRITTLVRQAVEARTRKVRRAEEAGLHPIPIHPTAQAA